MIATDPLSLVFIFCFLLGFGSSQQDERKRDRFHRVHASTLAAPPIVRQSPNGA